MTLENWNTLFQIASVMLLGLTFAVGFGALKIGNKVNKKQEERIATALREAGELRLKTVQAEKELLELQLRTRPRRLDREAFLGALTGHPNLPVEILYARDDADSLEFAQEIENQLVRAGWTVLARGPIPIPLQVRPGVDEIPTPMTVGGQPSGVTVVAHSVSEEEAQARGNAVMGKAWLKTPWTVLMEAFAQSMGSVRGSGNRICPEGRLCVIVAPRR